MWAWERRTEVKAWSAESVVVVRRGVELERAVLNSARRRVGWEAYTMLRSSRVTRSSAPVETRRSARRRVRAWKVRVSVDSDFGFDLESASHIRASKAFWARSRA
jgi:hypothetical protein